MLVKIVLLESIMVEIILEHALQSLVRVRLQEVNAPTAVQQLRLPHIVMIVVLLVKVQCVDVRPLVPV